MYCLQQWVLSSVAPEVQAQLVMIVQLASASQAFTHELARRACSHRQHPGPAAEDIKGWQEGNGDLTGGDSGQFHTLGGERDLCEF